MTSIRNSRTRLLTAAATVVIAALSLTACNDGTGARDEGASAGSSTNTAHTADKPAPQASSSPGGASKGSTSNSNGNSANNPPKSKAKDTTGNAPASTSRTVTCEGSNTKVVAAPLNRPVNHMLLTVTNTGSKTCFLYGYPALRFTDAQAVPPVNKDSQPQAVVTLNPGESGYASAALSATDGSSSNGRTAKSLTVYFQGRSGNESVGSGAHPQLPAKGTYIDDSLNVTYWQQSMDDAISW